MSDPERKFWEEISSAIGAMGDWDRIESHDTAPGFPDTDFTINGIDGKIELKFARGGVPEIRDTQVRWFRRRVRAKCNCWLFAKLIENGKIYYALFHGRKVPKLIGQPWPQWISLCDYLWIEHVEWETFIDIITLRRNDNETNPHSDSSNDTNDSSFSS